MVNVSIDGKKLQEIKMRLKGGSNMGVSYLSYPEHRIDVQMGKEEIILQVPPLLAIALYHNVFRTKKEIPVRVRNKNLGNFTIQDIHYNDELYGDGLIDIILKRVKNGKD